MAPPLTVIYEFERFRLDRVNQRLTRDGMLVPMPGKTLPLLVELIKNREHMVSVEKLVESIFPKSNFGEEELASEILALKRLLDDTQKRAPIIRTTIGQGYQFEAEVTEYLGDSASGQDFGSKSSEPEWAGTATAVQPKAKAPRGVLLGVAAAVFVLAGVGLWRFIPSHAGGASGGPPQVAVLPFQSLTGAANDDTFNRSLTQGIVSGLSSQAQLRVVSEEAMQHYLQSGVADPVTAGHQLGAQFLVRGMAQRLAGHILVKVQLLSAQDGSQIWVRDFEGDAKQIGALSAQISEKIGTGLPGADSGEQP